MSERAFPGSSINTIGMLLIFPACETGEVRRSVCRAIETAELFRLSLRENDGEAWLEDGAPLPECEEGEMLSADRAREEWERLTVTPMGGRLSRFILHPLEEGGTALAVLLHHILIDGYGMTLLAQRILDSLAGKECPPVPLLPPRP